MRQRSLVFTTESTGWGATNENEQACTRLGEEGGHRVAAPDTTTEDAVHHPDRCNSSGAALDREGNEAEPDRPGQAALTEIGIGPLTHEHGPLLLTFNCRDWKQPWTEPIQDFLRDEAAFALERGDLNGLGAWTHDQRLAGALLWRPISAARWEVAILATAFGFARRGIAISLKRHLLDDARAAGVQAVVSRIDRDNKAMIELNEKLGAGFNFPRLSRLQGHC